MKNRARICTVFFVLVCTVFLLNHRAHAGLEWSLLQQLDLKASPLDVASSPDGQWVYVLTPGEVLVYSAAKSAVTDRIPVDKAFDRISHSPQNNALIVTSSRKQTLKIIQIDEVHRFTYAGSPFKGPKNAPVTIAVFSDYQ